MHKRTGSVMLSASLILGAGVAQAAPNPQVTEDPYPCTTITSQLSAGNGYTHSITGYGPTMTVLVGQPPATEFVTKTLPYGVKEFTSTIPGTGSTPTCTIVYGRAEEREKEYLR